MDLSGFKLEELVQLANLGIQAMVTLVTNHVDDIEASEDGGETWEAHDGGSVNMEELKEDADGIGKIRFRVKENREEPESGLTLGYYGFNTGTSEPK